MGLAVVLAIASGAFGGLSDVDADFQQRGAGAVEIYGRDTTIDASGGPGQLQVRSTRAARARSALPYVYYYQPVCGGGPDGPDPTFVCEGAYYDCPPGQARYWAYRSPAAQPRRWTRTTQRCIPVDTPGAGGTELAVTVTEEELRALPLPSATSAVQPPGGHVLINIETNAYAVAEQVLIPTTVLDQPVTVRATPVAYAWDYGDGAAHGPTADPGGPYPALTNAHVYTAPGTYDLTVTTTYTAEFSIAGGPWLPIDGTADVASPPQTLTAHSARNHLVADLLP